MGSVTKQALGWVKLHIDYELFFLVHEATITTVHQPQPGLWNSRSPGQLHFIRASCCDLSVMVMVKVGSDGGLHCQQVREP